MMDLTEASLIFHNDPLKLKSHVGKEVRIVTKGNETYQGVVYTIDPVTESVVLTRQDERKQIALDLVFGHVITSMQILSEDEVKVDLFESEESPEDHEEAKSRLKAWLEKNLIVVEDHGSSLKCCSILTILPPYSPESCLSTNEIVLNNVQKLIRAMPSVV